MNEKQTPEMLVRWIEQTPVEEWESAMLEGVAE